MLQFESAPDLPLKTSHGAMAMQSPGPCATLQDFHQRVVQNWKSTGILNSFKQPAPPHERQVIADDLPGPDDYTNLLLP